MVVVLCVLHYFWASVSRGVSNSDDLGGKRICLRTTYDTDNNIPHNHSHHLSFRIKHPLHNTTLPQDNTTLTLHTILYPLPTTNHQSHTSTSPSTNTNHQPHTPHYSTPPLIRSPLTINQPTLMTTTSLPPTQYPIPKSIHPPYTTTYQLYTTTPSATQNPYTQPSGYVLWCPVNNVSRACATPCKGGEHPALCKGGNYYTTLCKGGRNPQQMTSCRPITPCGKNSTLYNLTSTIPHITMPYHSEKNDHEPCWKQPYQTATNNAWVADGNLSG